MTIHELKTWPEYFYYVNRGIKNFEIRKNDRDYKVGDVLCLKEYEPGTGKYTERICLRQITYIMKNTDFVKEGFVVMAIIPLEQTF